jgi:acetylornithine deacetylase/succinyl-diaminopimelate desuccinylase-like protein
VVEALHQDWSTDPFTFLEKDEYFYGRGTTDVKNDDASLITNVIRLKKEGFIPNRDIIIALTADNNPDNVMSVLKSVLADSQISVTRINSSFAAPLSPLREDVTGPVNQISSSMLPGVNVTPIMSTGATDGRYLRRQGIPVYGVSGMFGDMDDVRAHGKDERIGVKEFYDGVEFMYRFIKVLSSENNHNH